MINSDWPIIIKVIDSLHLNTSIIIFSMQIEEKIIKKDNITQIFTGEPLVRSIKQDGDL